MFRDEAMLCRDGTAPSELFLRSPRSMRAAQRGHLHALPFTIHAAVVVLFRHSFPDGRA
jgi:hypothetical protein